MTNKIITILISILFSSNSFSQKYLLIGINPSFNINSEYYSNNAFDLNILPINIELPITNNFDIRLISKLNYGFRTTGGAIISAGAELSLPFFIHKEKFENNIPYGFYIAPGTLFLQNVIYKHKQSSIFIEPGYNFLFNNKFSLIIGLQYGRKFFNYNNSNNTQVNHFGIKVILGFWLGK